MLLKVVRMSLSEKQLQCCAAKLAGPCGPLGHSRSCSPSLRFHALKEGTIRLIVDLLQDPTAEEGVAGVYFARGVPGSGQNFNVSR